MDVLTDPVKTACNHVYCWLCITHWLNEHTTCPACRRDLREARDQLHAASERGQEAVEWQQQPIWVWAPYYHIQPIYIMHTHALARINQYLGQHRATGPKDNLQRRQAALATGVVILDAEAVIQRLRAAYREIRSWPATARTYNDDGFIQVGRAIAERWEQLLWSHDGWCLVYEDFAELLEVEACKVVNGTGPGSIPRSEMRWR